MALLQISEPGLSAAPHQRRLAAVLTGHNQLAGGDSAQRSGRNVS